MGQAAPAVVRISILTQGGEEHATEPDKEFGDAVAWHLAHRDGRADSFICRQSDRSCLTGSACYRCRRLHCAGSVDCPVSPIMGMSTAPIIEIAFSFLAAANKTQDSRLRQL